MHIDFRNSKAEKVISLNGNDVKIKAICKGSDLTEEVAYNLIERTIEIKTGKTKFYNYKDVIQLPYYNKALEALISAIESKGYHWENPLGVSTEEIRQRHGDASEMFKEWLEYENKTFNPSKCLIFEIL